MLLVTFIIACKSENITDYVVMLNTRTPSTSPLLLNTNGGALDLNFKYGNGTESFASCGTLFQGDFYIFGGLGAGDTDKP